MNEFNDRASDEKRRAPDAKLLDFETRGVAAHAKAAQAYSRLLVLAETRDSGQIKRIGRFIASTYNGTAFSWVIPPFSTGARSKGLCSLE